VRAAGAGIASAELMVVLLHTKACASSVHSAG